MSKQFAIGIDLGTTNCVLAFVPLAAEPSEASVFPITQLVASNEVDPRNSLPSFLYLATEQERSDGAFDLPWKRNADFAAGQLARRRAADVPTRTVTAAKSWLAHSRVNRQEAILPWKAPDDVPKVSPVTASRRFLEHLIAAWEAAHPDAPFCQQDVVVTVPASFDPSARELTREAALSAGCPDSFVLLEEPQAAIYAWLNSVGEQWRKMLSVGEQLLVCDVGGGTTDLSLIGVTEQDGELALERIAVGSHLLLGGDNMDVALAHHAAELFSKKDVKLDPWQSVALWHSCRLAKEELLAADGPATRPVSVLGRGSKLIQGTVSVELDKEQAAELLLEGFFPKCDTNDRPRRGRTSGFQEIGLAFETDTAVTKHLAAFLRDQGPGAESAEINHVVLNGGVFKSPAIQNRLLEALRQWSSGDHSPNMLRRGTDLEASVARGAAFYAWTKENGGVRIRGGTARSYYVGMETAGLAIPGAPRPLSALCVVPMGMEEGTETDVPSDDIGLVVDQPATFRFFGSTTRHDDKPGDVLSSWAEDELTETNPLEANLKMEDAIDEPYVPVKFQSRITELGMFELWCVSTRTGDRWKLEFSVREP